MLADSAPSPAGAGAADRIRVLFVGHTGLLGGAEIMLQHMAGGLAAHGVEAIVVLGSEGPLVERLRRAQVAVHVVPVGSLAGARRRSVPLGPGLLLDGVKWVRAIGQLIRALDIDVVVTNSQKAHLAASLAARIAGVPVVWRLHDIVVPPTFGPAQIAALRLAAALSHPRVLGVSRVVETAARTTLGIADSTCLHNGVDIDRLRSHRRLDLRERFEWPREAVVLGMIGRLVRWKGCLELVEAAHLVLKETPSARFVLVGDEMIDVASGFRDEILDRIAQLGLTEKVRLLPFTDEVGAVLADLDVLVQPSIEPDPFPTAVVEAAVMGAPVIASDNGGVAEIVVDGVHGRLVKPGSISALAEACVGLVVDDLGRKRMAGAIGEDSVRFNADRMCGDLARELRLVVEDRTD